MSRVLVNIALSVILVGAVLAIAPGLKRDSKINTQHQKILMNPAVYISDAETLIKKWCDEYGSGENSNILPEDLWPNSFSVLKPQAIRIRNRGEGCFIDIKLSSGFRNSMIYISPDPKAIDAATSNISERPSPYIAFIER